MKKLLFIFGTRPELIKLVPVIKLVNEDSFFQSICVSTGQHKEMLEPIIEAFSISVDYNLAIMKNRQTISEITISILNGLENILVKEKPDMVLVHGDTTTALAATLAAYYQKIPVGHIEAGLRSGDMYSPFPEEGNRILIDQLSSIHFPPTIANKQNLLNENIKEKEIYVTGNTAIDMFKYTLRDDFTHELLAKSVGYKIILFTMHRRENLGNPMKNAFFAINRLLENCEDIVVIFPIHFNPLVRELAKKYLKTSSRLFIVEPLEVIEFHNILSNSYLIMSDSGGIQEEAPYIGVPTIILRHETERPEGVESGSNFLVGTQEDDIYNVAHNLIVNEVSYKKVAKKRALYGDGHACQKMVEALEQYFIKEKDTQYEKNIKYSYLLKQKG